MVSQITSLIIVYSTVYSVADQRKHKSSALLARVRGIYQWPVNSPPKGAVARKFSIWWRREYFGRSRLWHSYTYYIIVDLIGLWFNHMHLMKLSTSDSWVWHLIIWFYKSNAATVWTRPLGHTADGGIIKGVSCIVWKGTQSYSESSLEHIEHLRHKM